jgi:hypothetical protein
LIIYQQYLLQRGDADLMFSSKFLSKPISL